MALLSPRTSPQLTSLHFTSPNLNTEYEMKHRMPLIQVSSAFLLCDVASLCILFPTFPVNSVVSVSRTLIRTAQLTSRRYILNTYSTNIRTEYFKLAA
jgi:hypothetical protein